jgi:hypothetical protein
LEELQGEVFQALDLLSAMMLSKTCRGFEKRGVARIEDIRSHLLPEEWLEYLHEVIGTGIGSAGSSSLLLWFQGNPSILKNGQISTLCILSAVENRQLPFLKTNCFRNNRGFGFKFSGDILCRCHVSDSLLEEALGVSNDRNFINAFCRFASFRVENIRNFIQGVVKGSSRPELLELYGPLNSLTSQSVMTFAIREGKFAYFDYLLDGKKIKFNDVDPIKCEAHYANSVHSISFQRWVESSDVHEIAPAIEYFSRRLGLDFSKSTMLFRKVFRSTLEDLFYLNEKFNYLESTPAEDLYSHISMNSVISKVQSLEVMLHVLRARSDISLNPHLILVHVERVLATTAARFNPDASQVFIGLVDLLVQHNERPNVLKYWEHRFGGNKAFSYLCFFPKFLKYFAMQWIVDGRRLPLRLVGALICSASKAISLDEKLNFLATLKSSNGNSEEIQLILKLRGFPVDEKIKMVSAMVEPSRLHYSMLNAALDALVKVAEGEVLSFHGMVRRIKGTEYALKDFLGSLEGLLPMSFDDPVFELLLRKYRSDCAHLLPKSVSVWFDERGFAQSVSWAEETVKLSKQVL